MQRKLKLVTLHGNTDRAAHDKFHTEQFIMKGVKEADRKIPPCEVLAVFKGDDDQRLELIVRDWDEVAKLKQYQDYTVTVE